jgi:hypothetical protein
MGAEKDVAVEMRMPVLQPTPEARFDAPTLVGRAVLSAPERVWIHGVVVIVAAARWGRRALPLT